MPTRPTSPNPGRPGRAINFAKLLVRWFRLHARDLPWRRSLDPYAIWISEVMLQQTQVKTVIPFWERWMLEVPTIDALANLPESRLLKLWEGLGYYTRVRNLQKAARQIASNREGGFPSDPAQILELPGIGRYTAGAIASIAYGQAQPLLDGNVVRVLTRAHGIRKNAREKPTVDQLWKLATELVIAAETLDKEPQQGTRLSAGPCSDLNQGLMELGATICLPSNPACPACPLRQQCIAAAEGLVDQIPDLGKRPKTTARRFIAFVAESTLGVLVTQRPTVGVNGGLWEFPSVEINDHDAISSPVHGFSFDPAEKPLLTIKHSITRYRITLEVFPATVRAGRSSRPAGRWIPKAELHALAFTSAHAKIRTKIT